MDLSSPEVWRWIWLGAAVLFGLGELSTAGSFFLLPFAIGALAAMIVVLLITTYVPWLSLLLPGVFGL